MGFINKLTQAITTQDFEGLNNSVKPPRPQNNTGCASCRQIRDIISGFGRLAFSRILGVKPPGWVLQRAEICAKCKHRTWLNIMEWGLGITSKTDLPINHKPGPWDALWCAKCKCCIEAKIRAPGTGCIVGKWLPLEGTEPGPPPAGGQNGNQPEAPGQEG